jgi:hypothetical protein
MSTRYPSTYNSDWLLDGQSSSFRASNMGPYDPNADTASLTTQVLTSVAIALQPGDVITNITFKSGATAAGTPTNWWFALYSSAATPALLAQSADQLTAAWAANTVQTLALSTAQLITTAGVYYAAVMVKATTPPTLVGANLGIAGAGASILSSKVLAQTSGSALTTTAPPTIASGTTIATVPLVVLT